MGRKFNLFTGKWDETGGSSAADDATVITVDPEPGLPNSRQIAEGNGIVLEDHGAGATIEVNVSDLYDPILTMGG